MATVSAIASLPRPDLADPPNGPSAFNSLTDALDKTIIPRFGSAAARDAKITSPSGGQHAWLTDSNTLTAYSTAQGDWVSYPVKTSANAVQAEDSTAISGFTSSTPSAGSPVVGFVFVAPPGGSVYVTVSGIVEQAANTNTAHIGYEVRAGGTIGSGTVTLSASFLRAIQAGTAVITGAPSTAAGSHRRMLSGLTPGSTYNVRAMHWVSSGSGTVKNRAVLVEPVL